MAKAILPVSDAIVNTTKITCTHNTSTEILSLNDLLESITILLRYILQRNMPRTKRNTKTKWPTKKLGEVSSIVTGSTPKTSITKFYGDEFLWAGPSDLKQGKYILNTKKKLSIDGFNNSGARKVPKGSVLMSCIGNIGKLGIAIEEMATNQQINTFVPNTKLLDSEYLYYVLQTKVSDFEHASSKTTVPIINKTKCSRIEIPLPPLEEQKRIVEALEEKLGKVKEAIQLRQDAIADTEKILSAKLTEIFTEGKEKGWEEKKIEDLAFVGTGATPLKSNSEYYNGDIPWITSKSTNRPFVTEADDLITELALKETNCKLYPKGTLIVAMYGQGKTRGQVSELMIEAATNQACAAVSVNSQNSNKFIKYFFVYNYEKTRMLAEGGPQLNLSLGKIKKMKLSIPDLKTQEKIVKELDELSARVAKLRALQESQLADLRALERAYLREVFNGEL